MGDGILIAFACSSYRFPGAVPVAVRCSVSEDTSTWPCSMAMVQIHHPGFLSFSVYFHVVFTVPEQIAVPSGFILSSLKMPTQTLRFFPLLMILPL
jgi:hypothetical protein